MIRNFTVYLALKVAPSLFRYAARGTFKVISPLLKYLQTTHLYNNNVLAQLQKVLTNPTTTEFQQPLLLRSLDILLKELFLYYTAQYIQEYVKERAPIIEQTLADLFERAPYATLYVISYVDSLLTSFVNLVENENWWEELKEAIEQIPTSLKDIERFIEEFSEVLSELAREALYIFTSVPELIDELRVFFKELAYEIGEVVLLGTTLLKETIENIHLLNNLITWAIESFFSSPLLFSLYISFKELWNEPTDYSVVYEYAEQKVVDLINFTANSLEEVVAWLNEDTLDFSEALSLLYKDLAELVETQSWLFKPLKKLWDEPTDYSLFFDYIEMETFNLVDSATQLYEGFIKSWNEPTDYALLYDYLELETLSLVDSIISPLYASFIEWWEAPSDFEELIKTYIALKETWNEPTDYTYMYDPLEKAAIDIVKSQTTREIITSPATYISLKVFFTAKTELFLEKQDLSQIKSTMLKFISVGLLVPAGVEHLLGVLDLFYQQRIYVNHEKVITQPMTYLQEAETYHSSLNMLKDELQVKEEYSNNRTCLSSTPLVREFEELCYGESV